MPPRIDAIRLPGLDEGIEEDLRSRDTVERKRFSRLDIGGEDLSGAAFSECSFDDISASESNFRAATFTEVTFTRLNAPIFLGARTRLRDVSIDSSRLGSAEMYESNFTSVRFSGSKLDFFNASGSGLQDVLFENCTIDELDLSGAKLQRVSFVDTTIRTLRLRQTRLTDVDLRGAQFSQIDGFESLSGVTLSSYQVALLSDSFAAHLGVRVED